MFDLTSGQDALLIDVTEETPIQLLVRGGHIIPTQMYANNTANR